VSGTISYVLLSRMLQMLGRVAAVMPSWNANATTKCNLTQLWYRQDMSEEEEKKGKRDRRDFRWAAIPAVIFLLLYLVIPKPWNDYSLVLGIAFAVITAGVLVTR